MPAILHEPGARGRLAFMPRTRLQRCPACLSYGFSRKCDCGGTRVAVAPLRFSPEDPQEIGEGKERAGAQKNG